MAVCLGLFQKSLQQSSQAFSGCGWGLMLLVEQCKRCSQCEGVWQAGENLAGGYGRAKDLLVLSLHGDLSCPLQGRSGFSWQYQSVCLCVGCGYLSISTLWMKGGMQIVSANLVLAGHSQPAVSVTSTSQGSVFSPIWRGREQVRREGKKAEGGEKELCVGSQAQLHVTSGMYWAFAVRGEVCLPV